MVKIGINASGGDWGAIEIVAGVIKASKNPELNLVLYGNEKDICSNLQEEDISSNIELNFTSRPNQELCEAFDDLENHKIQAVLTASNSRDLLAVVAAHLYNNVPRPGLIAPIPVLANSGSLSIQASGIPPKLNLSYLLDVGATAKTNDLETFLGWATIGRKFLQSTRQISDPRIGLYNIAAERACPEIKNVYENLKSFPGFVGYIEPESFLNGKCNLCLTDGFTGNWTLKTLEAYVPFTIDICREKIHRFPEPKGMLEDLKSQLLSYDAHLISPLLGVRGGWVFRIHGAAKAAQIAKAFELVTRYPIDQPI